jgi:hypothetical protein
MSRRRWIREQWETYRLIIPRDASKAQLIETRRAFYAGAGALFELVTNLSEGSEPQASDLQKMSDIQKELHDFLDEHRAEHGGETVRMGNA